MSKLMPWRNQRGDTIVEVLIVIIVLSVVLTSAYAVATRSSQVNQAAQEHSFALKIAETQLEYLRSYVYSNPAGAATLFTNTNGFCLDSALNVIGLTQGGVSPTQLLENEVYANYSGACVQKADGTPNGSTNCAETHCYYYALRRMNTPADPYAFTAYVRWDGATTNRQQVMLSYRVRP